MDANARKNRVSGSSGSAYRRLATATVAVLALVACSEKGPTDPTPNTMVDATAFLNDSMPAWSAYSPLQASMAPGPTGPAESLPEVVVPSVETVNEAGEIETLTNQAYVCTETPYSMADTPDRIVMYNPSSFLWAGALIQGASHRNLGNLGNLQQLTVDERAPITVTIPDLLGVRGDIRIQVDNPSLSSVAQAVNDIIGNATESELETPSDINFQLQTYDSESAVGLNLGASGRYLGFKAATSYQSSIAESETTVTAEFYEKMFTVTVDPPSTPAGFFSDELTGEVLSTKYRTTITPENPPLYIAAVVYGRALMYSMTSTATASQMKAAMNASFESIAGGASVHVSKRDSTLLAESEISVVSLGGSASNVLNLIRENNLSAYFEDDAPLTSARPLAYVLMTLDGQLAQVTEATEYTVRECQPRGTGRLNFLDPQTMSSPLGGALAGVAGDFDGDDYEDLVFNERSGGSNTMFIAHGSSDGTFEAGPSIAHPADGGGIWGQYRLQVADLNGDGIDDLFWNVLNTTTNMTYTALADGAGGFTFPAASAHLTPANWTSWDSLAVAGDFDGDGDTDLAWASTTSGGLVMDWAIGHGDGTFTYQPIHTLSTNHGFAGYRQIVAANFDADPAYEVVVQDLSGAQNAAHLAEVDPANNRFELAGVTVDLGNWSGYNHQVADLDGVLGSDLVFWAGADGIWTYQANGNTGDGQSRFDYNPASQTVLSSMPAGFEMLVGDFDADFRDDLLFNKRDGNTNDVLIAYGSSNFEIQVPAAIFGHQLPPSSGWGQYETHILDVNGDGKDDVVWANPSSQVTFYVGLAR